VRPRTLARSLLAGALLSVAACGNYLGIAEINQVSPDASLAEDARLDLETDATSGDAAREADDASTYDAPTNADTDSDGPPPNYCDDAAVTYRSIDAANMYTESSEGVVTQTMVFPFVVRAQDSTVGLTQAPVFRVGKRPGSLEGRREITISRSKCNFDKRPEFTVVVANDYSDPFNWSVAINDPNRPAAVRLTTGTWYVNIRNLNAKEVRNITLEYDGIR
jgi:hypothetical protein